MKNLWRALALTWLGGIASPLLYDNPLITDAPSSAIGTPSIPSPGTPDPYDPRKDGEVNASFLDPVDSN